MAKNDKTNKNSGSMANTKPSATAKPVADSAKPFASAGTKDKGGSKGAGKGGPKGGTKTGGKKGK